MFLSGINTETNWKGAFITATNCNLSESGQTFSNCLQLIFRSISETIPVDLGRSNLATDSMKESDTLILLLCLLLARPMETILSELFIDGSKVKIEEEPRRTRFGINEIIEIFGDNKLSRMARYCAVISSEGWPLLEQLFDAFKQQSDQCNASLDIPLRWFAKGNSEFISTDKLICHWIAFNSLYANPQARETDAISDYVRNRIPHIVAEQFVHSNHQTLLNLSQCPINLERKKLRHIAEELASTLTSKPCNPLYIAELALLTIYAIRNMIFHGDLPPNSKTKTWDWVWIAETALASIVRGIIMSSISGDCSTDAAFVKQVSLSI